jgi:hypothetical protein
LPIATVLKRDSVAISFMLHFQQNDERSAERAEIKTDQQRIDSPFEVRWSRQAEREI